MEPLLIVGDILVSTELLTEDFCCDPGCCLGACCIEGDAGAPLEAGEAEVLQREYPAYKDGLSQAGRETLENEGFSTTDPLGKPVTPLISGKECAYIYFDGGVAKCGIEKAWFEGKTPFRKPVSCHLYPVRISSYGEVTAVNYNRWHICIDAMRKGKTERIPLYDFLKEALVRRFGQAWYDELCLQAEEYRKKEGLDG